MEHADGGRTSQGSNDEQTGPKASSAGKRSPGRDTIEEVSIRKPTLSVQDIFAGHNEDREYSTPPVTPAVWTETPSPAEARVSEALKHFPKFPPAPPEGDDSERNNIDSKQNLIVRESLDNEEVSHAFDWGKNPSGVQSQRDDERERIREVTHDAHPVQRWGWGGALLGQGEPQGNSPNNDSFNLIEQRDVSSANRAIVDGENLTRNLARNDVDHGRSFLGEDGAGKGEVNDVDPEEMRGRMQSSASIRGRASFLQSSSDESIGSVGKSGEGRNPITIVGRLREESRRSLPHSEVGIPYVGDDCPENQQNRDPDTSIKDSEGPGRMDQEVKHIRERETTRNDPVHNEHWEGWLEDEDEHREERGGSPSQPRVSPQTRRDIPDSRLFPQSGDFERRRSSLFSVHFGNGSLLGNVCQGMPRSLSPTPSTRSARRQQNGTLSASKRNVPDQTAFARLRAIPSGTLVDGGEGKNSTGDLSQAEQALTSHEASAYLPASSRHNRSAKNASPLGTLFSSGASTGTIGSSMGKNGETTGSSSFSPFSTMSDSDESNGGTIGVHDLLEELDTPNAEEKREDGGRSDEEKDAKDGVERGDPNDLQMGLLDAEDITFLLKSQKLRETLFLVEDLYFGKLPLTRQVKLLRDLSVVHCAKGEAIFRQGESSDTLYFILDTTTSTTDTLLNKGWHQADGTSKLLISETDPGEGEECFSREFWPSGRTLGEEGLIYSSERPRSSTIRAAVGISCAVVRAPAFANWWEFRLHLLTKKVVLLSKLAPTTQANLLNYFNYADFQADEVIIREGEPGDKFYIITCGTAIVTTNTEPALAFSIFSSDDDIITDDDDATALDVEKLPPFTSAERREDDGNDGSDIEGAVTHDRNRPSATGGAVQDMAGEECSIYVVNRDRCESEQTRSEAPLNEKGAGNVSLRVMSATVSSSPEKAHFKDTKESSRSPIVAEEIVLTRLYEGNSFGEMALVYDEPRNANVRAVTEMTCLVLEKDAFRKCLEDKAFHKHIEQATLQRACYREQREREFEGRSPRSTLGGDLEVPQPAFSARRSRVTARDARSSFRFTAKMVRRRGGDKANHDREVNNYRVLKKVGEGSFGNVYKVVNVYTDDVYAMKVINKPSKGGQKLKKFEQSLRREVSVMKVLRHPNIVTLLEVINDPRSRKVYMIQEFMERGPLLKEEYNVEPIPENEAVSKFIQAAKGLQYVHNHGIFHGDIKPANILEDHHGRVKIADFGACVLLDQDDEDGANESSSNSSEGPPTPTQMFRNWRKLKKSGHRIEGTPGFQAPELFEEGDAFRISFASDVWALGITLYQMVVGRMPFFGSSYRALMSAIKMEALTFPADCALQPYLMNLLHRMLRKNPTTRITLEEVMRHEWVTKEGLRPFGLENSAEENSMRFSSTGSTAYRGSASRSTSPKSARRASSPSRLPNPDSPRNEALEGRNLSMDTDAQDTPNPMGHSTPVDGYDESKQMGDGEGNNLPDRNFSRMIIENFMNKRWGNFPPGIVCDAQKIVVEQPSFPHEDWSSSSREKKKTAPTLQVTKSKSTLSQSWDPRLPSTRDSREMSPLLSESPLVTTKEPRPSFSVDVKEPYYSPSVRWQREWQQQPTHWKPRSSPLGALRQMSLPQLLGDSQLSWRESFLDESTPSGLPTILREELDDSMALERSQRLVRKADFLMLKTDSTKKTNTRLVVSAKSGFSLVRPSGDRKVGSRRSSAWSDSLRHSFAGPGDVPRMPHISPFPVKNRGDEVEAPENRLNEERIKHAEGVHTNSASASNSPPVANRRWAVTKRAGGTTRFTSRFRPLLKGASNKGDPSGDHNPSSTACASRLLFPVNVERTEKRSQAATVATSTAMAGKVMFNSNGSMKMTTACGTSSAAPSGDNSVLKPWTEQTKAGAWDDSAGTGRRWDITALSFSRPISTQHPLPAFHDPMCCIDEEEPKKTKDSLANFSEREFSSSSRTCNSNFDLPCDDKGKPNMDGSIESSESSSSSSSDDGLGEETSVADITDCLEYIGEAVMERDDKELAILDRAEILAFSKSAIHRSLSSTSSGGSKGLTGFKHEGRSPAKAAPIDRDDYNFGHVEARTWGGQVNAGVGVRFGVSLNQGNLGFMEDAATCLPDAFEFKRRMESKPPGDAPAPADPATVGAPETEPSQEAAAYFGVFDGHGGADVAIHLQDVLHQRVLGDPSFPSNIPKAIFNGCMATDLKCLELAHVKRLEKINEDKASSLQAPRLKRQGSDENFSGAVATMAILYRPPSPRYPSVLTHSMNSSEETISTDASGTSFSAPHQGFAYESLLQQFRHPVYLHVANVGDCRAVLCRAGKAVVLTQDHTPAVPSEVARIEAAGGFVSRCRVNGILGVSRSFGDIHCKTYPPRQGRDLWSNQQVVSRPEVHSMELTPADSFLILACDGVWGVLSNQQAVSFVHRRLLMHRDVQRAAVELIDKALDSSSYDNCSCIVVCLNQTRLRVKKRPTRALSRMSHSSISSSST